MTDFVDQLGFSRTDPMQTLQAAATATGNGTSMQVRGMEAVLLNVSGITSATIVVEGTSDNTTWTTLTVKDANTGAQASSITANGFYSVAFEGLLNIRARISAYTSGTITVSGSPATVTTLGGGGGTTVADGANTVEGATTDAAIVSDANGSLSGKLRGLVKIFADVWDSSNHWIKVSVASKLAGEDTTVDVLKVEQRFSFQNITTNATTTVKNGTGFLHSIVINTKGASANTATIYDNTAGSGTKIGTIDTTSAIGTLTYNAIITNGITIVTATGTAADITVNYR